MEEQNAEGTANVQPQETEQQTLSLSEQLLQPPQSSAQSDGSQPDPWEGDGWKDLLRPDFKTPEGEVDVKALAKAYKGAEKRIGAGDIPPKDETGYKIEAVLPEGVTLDPEKQTSFFKGAHAKGMTNAQVNWVMEQYGNLITEAQQLQAAQQVDHASEAERTLKEEWGDKFPEQMAMAQRAFHKVADEKDKAAIDQIGNNAAILRLLAKLGGNLKEDPGLPADIAGMAPEDVASLQKSEAYWNPKHPDHDKVKARVTRYYQATAGRK